jgi:hypothetical protein
MHAELRFVAVRTFEGQIQVQQSLALRSRRMATAMPMEAQAAVEDDGAVILDIIIGRAAGKRGTSQQSPA